MTPEELIRIVSLHPAVAEVPQPQPERFVELGVVYFRMNDGRGLGINPDLFPAGGTGIPEQELVSQVHQHLEEAWQQSINRPPLDLANVVPIVRDASYFMDRGGARVALVAKLTDFIGIGLVIDEPSSMRVITEDELPQPRTDVEDLQFLSRAFENFGALAHDILVQDMGYDSDVIAVKNPPAYEVSWFAQAAHVAKALAYYSWKTGTPWVAIPAFRKDLWLVNSTTRHWGELMDLLEPNIDARERVHPVPHVVVDGRWQEYVPQLEPATRRRLQTLKFNAENVVHRACRDALQRHGETRVDLMSDFLGTFAGDDVVTFSEVPLDLEATSIPRVDLVDFMDGGNTIHRVWFERLVAELPHLVRPHPQSYPPRFIIGRPGPEDRARLAAIQL
ncbi:hypothetical protein FBF34_11980 [Arachnia propionica]|jgi:hypothetical protein|uniref:Uncharacterized protein n=2 Tax=Arachnia propionica TaxID=1750 RepID=A0AB37HWH8_9ACTN|nr:hypothetical protein [Arachnia propionica]AFN46457.1 hypothetical protein HMPREF9154_2479 [Arachnia propionica F0230a]QCT38616.1 hypothetical protein FBF34_11980 [Arachnia propionica]QUC11781.1 hypothetical protein J5A53_03545 [Arachnia propionica]QUC13528.1 hypothetical protein J5A61_11745 [Arachnia propionica]RPA18602.1 hypothetical protein EGT56_12000 [Arachnia propionica]